MLQTIREQRTEPFVTCQLLADIRDSEVVLPYIVTPWFDKAIENSDPNSKADAAVGLLQVQLS